MKVGTPQGIREATSQEIARIEELNPYIQFKKEIFLSRTDSEKLNAILTYLGVN